MRTNSPWLGSVFELGRDTLRKRERGPSWKPKRAPMPPWIPVVGHLPTRDSSVLTLLEKAHATVGPVVRFEFPFATAHSLAAPDDIERVFISEQKRFGKKTRGYDVLRIFLGNGLVTSEGEFWKRQRRIAAPAFHKKRIDGFGATMLDQTQRAVQKILDDKNQHGAVDLATNMSELTLAIAGITLLSSDPSERADEVYEALGLVLHSAIDAINRPTVVPMSWPTPRNLRFRKAAATLDDVVYGIIHKRRNGEGKDDLLQMFMEAKDEETGESMDDKQLRDEVMTMFLAGHETTATTLSWTMHLLHQNPTILANVIDEIEHADSVDAIMQCGLLRRVVQESMRLYPPVWIVGRSPNEDIEVSGYDIAKHTLLFISPWVVHRSPTLWQDALTFDPDRFLPERAKLQHKLQYIPFIAGPRMCIGSGFAMMEAQVILAVLLRALRFEPIRQQVEPDPLITIRPLGGLWMKVSARDTS